jgi:SRSO17 transposase
MSASMNVNLLTYSSDDSDAIHRCRLHGDTTGYERKRKRRSRRVKRQHVAALAKANINKSVIIGGVLTKKQRLGQRYQQFR